MSRMRRYGKYGLTFSFFSLLISHVGPAYLVCVCVRVAAARVEFQERAA